MLTKKDKDLIIKAFKSVDVKKMSIEHDDQDKLKWYRFGNYNAMQLAIEIIKNLPEHKSRKNINKP